jgi:perosamine synthetase
MVTALWDRTLSVPKEAVIDSLRARGVETRPFFYPLSSLAAYADVASARAAASANSVAYDLSQRGLNLPSALALTEDQVRYAAQCFRDVLLGCR